MAQRVYHPTLSAWEDVPEDRVDEWEAAGWLSSKPDHVDDSQSLPAVVTNQTRAKRTKPDTTPAQP